MYHNAYSPDNPIIVAAYLQDLQRFLRHLRAEGRSPATLRLYGQAVTFFSRAWNPKAARPQLMS